MAKKESYENPLKNWLWGCRGHHCAPHSRVVDSIPRHLLTDLRHAALPLQRAKYTPPGGLNVAVIVMVTAQTHQGVEVNRRRITDASKTPEKA